MRLLLPLIRRADFTIGDLLRSREETDPKVVAIRTLGADATDLTVADVARRTRAIARGLLAIVGDEPETRVAILSENCLEAALCDLACLTNGIVDFPLPANAVAEQVVYMLKHSRAQVLLVSDEEQVAKVLPSLAGLPDLKALVVFDHSCADRHGLLSLDQMIGQGAGFDEPLRAARAERVKVTDMATVMYTSGTTGRPKGIIFTHENLVSKRLCRGFALPEVGEGDVFLCYLPLYHTFGRWLELMGSLWWGATYVFARSTAQSSLLEDFRSVKPTVFISVPKKWIELQDAAAWEAAGEDEEETAGHLRVITGGRLRYGLSAAGYLDPVVFKTFHRAGVELCSGYGMTEATGGITMTPPGDYVDGSIGVPLPGHRVPPRRRRRAPDPRRLRLARLPRRRAGGGRRPRAGRLVPHRRPGQRGRRPLPHHRPQEGDLQEPRRPDHRPAARGEPLPRLRRRRPGLPGRRSPRVQHAAGLAQLRGAAAAARPLAGGSCATSSPRWWPAPTASWPPSSGWWPSRCCRARSTPSTAS